MSKRLVLDPNTNILPNGIMEIRFQKQELDDDGNVVRFKYHRTTCEPGVSIDNQIALVEMDLARASRGRWPSLDDTSRTRLRQIAQREHTPTKIAARRAEIAAPEAK